MAAVTAVVDGPNGTKANGDLPTDAMSQLSMGGKNQLPKPPAFKDKYEERKWIKFRLAQAFRIFAYYDLSEGAAGHITCRDPVRPDCYWLNPLGLHFACIQPSNLILVDHHGVVQVEESGPLHLVNTAAYMIHSAIHQARPDVLCAAHSHTIHGKAFAALGVNVDMLSQDSTAFYNDVALYNQFRGIVLDEQEGNAIVEAMGNKKAAILQNHGLLVASQSIEATVHFFRALERTCQVQLLADAAAGGRGHKTVKISDEEAQKTGSLMGSHITGYVSGWGEFQYLELREGVTFKME